MKVVLYIAGRSLQLLALLTLPSAIWVGHWGHSESGAIMIFIVSVIIFFVGWVLCKVLA